jgi:hypothetical protein
MSGTQDSIGIEADNHADYSGFEKPSRVQYNANVGRKANAPLSGGDRQAAYDALTEKSSKAV